MGRPTGTNTASLLSFRGKSGTTGTPRRPLSQEKKIWLSCCDERVSERALRPGYFADAARVSKEDSQDKAQATTENKKIKPRRQKRGNTHVFLKKQKSERETELLGNKNWVTKMKDKTINQPIHPDTQGESTR